MKQTENEEEESIGQVRTPWNAERNEIVHRWSKSTEENKTDGIQAICLLDKSYKGCSDNDLIMLALMNIQNSVISRLT